MSVGKGSDATEFCSIRVGAAAAADRADTAAAADRDAASDVVDVCKQQLNLSINTG